MPLTAIVATHYRFPASSHRLTTSKGIKLSLGLGNRMESQIVVPNEEGEKQWNVCRFVADS